MIVGKTYTFFLATAWLLIISCQQQHRPFEKVSSSQTHIDFTNHVNDRQDLSILSYIYYYNGGGVAIGDVNNDGLPDIYFTANNKGGNKLYLNQGNFEFEDITKKAGVAGSSDWCSGVTMADVNGDGLLDIYVCAIANAHALKGHNELFINNGISSSSGDGRPARRSANVGVGEVTFTESSAKYGLDFSGLSTQAVFFDYDHDGDLDCFILNQSEHPNQNIGDTSNRRKFDANSGERLFRNDVENGKMKFTDVSARAGIYQSSLCYGLGIAVADLNNDGWEDIYVGNDFHENDYYYINNGFSPSPKGEGPARLRQAFGDSRGEVTFTESGANHFRHYSRYSMGNDIADFNNDGQLDIVTVDMLPGDEKTLKTYGNGEHLDTYIQKITKNGYQNQYSKNCLQKNNGDGVSFSDVGLISGISATDWSWSPLLMDFDNDGNKDLFISSGIVKRPLDLDFIMFFSNIKDPGNYGSVNDYQKAMLDKMPDGSSHPYLFKGDGNLNFKDVSEAWGTADIKGFFNGAAYADLDNDGNEDIVINCLNDQATILKNNASKKNYLSFSFKGNDLNTSGIGTKLYVYAGGKMQYQQLMLTRGFMSSSEPRLHFGLDSLHSADSILVVWPNQNYQLLKNVRANQQIVCKQNEATLHFDYKNFFPPKKAIAENISHQVNTDWKHEEDNFIDFKTQYLIPHIESTRGPKLAVADINKDGLDDIFVCGAKGQAGSLMIQNKNGQFIQSDTNVFNKTKSNEAVDAVFFDANNDGYADLYVVSGGNEYGDGDPNLQDHLYINDGKGHLTESINALPAILKNKSCVAVADVNKDGYNDLFIGVLSSAKKYGYEKESSYLLLNDGKGHFTAATDSTITLGESGMATSAAFTDVNHDGWIDLIVAGEWMPMKIFINQHGVFREKDVARSSGLWQNIYVTDINGDGYPDILAGNWGHNSKLYEGKDGNLKLYIKDFDLNGSVEQIMTYSINGQEYPFLGKDQLELALPALKRGHLSYDEAAGKTVQFLFGDLLKDCTALQAETLSSSCFINDDKGNFTRNDLPAALQLSPIFSFASWPAMNKNNYIASGNFYGVLPYEGRYDAMNPTIFNYDKNSAQFNVLSEFSEMDGEFRDAKWINYINGIKVLVIARNDAQLIFLKPLP